MPMYRTTCAILGWGPNETSTTSSVGELNANCEAKVMAEDGVTELGKNQRGELWVRAPNIMKGYWQNPKATKETLTEDGWLKSGDICYINDYGKFYVVDRKKVRDTRGKKLFKSLEKQLTVLELGTHQGEG